MSVTPADVPTPDAIRPEWVEKARVALHDWVGDDGGVCQTCESDVRIVIAAVCGDIVEAARRDALTEAVRLIRDSFGINDAAQQVIDLRDGTAP